MKSYSEFLNENLFGQYNYYGNGSLFPIIQKLKNEGKSIEIIISYMRSLGIDEDRQREVLSKLFPVVICNEALLIEETSLESIKNSIEKTDAIGEDPKDEEDKKDPLKSALTSVTKKDKSASKEDKLDILQSVLKDAEKLEKIKKILAESMLN